MSDAQPRDETGLQKLMNEAADIIERSAIVLRESHTVAGRWPEGESGARDEYDAGMTVVRRLRGFARFLDPL